MIKQYRNILVAVVAGALITIPLSPASQEISLALATFVSEAEPVVEETTSEPVVEETTSEPVVEEATSEPVVEETTSEPVVEETTSEPVVVETTSEPVVEETTSEPAVEENPVTVSDGAIEYTEGTAKKSTEIQDNDSTLARVDVFQEANYSVRLVFVGYEDVALWWQSAGEAIASMTVAKYPQTILNERHGVPVDVSDPLVQSAVAEVMTFFAPDGEAEGSLEIEESSSLDRSVRVIFDGSSIDVVFGGGWESGKFIYDSKEWALSDLVDGGYVEGILSSRFGADPSEIRPLLAEARNLIESR